jgi:ketosteroid isomerase-like protein
MSEERGRSEMVVEALSAFVGGGPESLLPYLSEDVVWEDDPEWPDSEVAHGRDGVRAILHERLDSTSFDPALERVVERGELVLALFRWTAMGEASGATAMLFPAVLFEFSGPLIARVRFFLARERAWEEFGGETE